MFIPEKTPEKSFDCESHRITSPEKQQDPKVISMNSITKYAESAHELQAIQDSLFYHIGIDTEKVNITVLKFIDCMMERGTSHFWQGMLSLAKDQFASNQNDSSDGGKSDVSGFEEADVDLDDLPDQYILSNTRATLL